MPWLMFDEGRRVLSLGSVDTLEVMQARRVGADTALFGVARRRACEGALTPVGLDATTSLSAGGEYVLDDEAIFGA